MLKQCAESKIYSACRNILITGLFFIYLTGCSSTSYQASIPGSELQTGSFQLEKHYSWDPLYASKIILDQGNLAEGNLFRIYEDHDFTPLWLTRGSLNDNSRELIASLQTSWKDGLNAELYQLDEIYSLINKLHGKRKMNKKIMKNMIRLDVHFTNAYLDYASDLLTGRVNPDRLDSIWEAHPRQEQLVLAMENALEEKDVARSLQKFKPDKTQYFALSEMLEKFIRTREEGGWELPGYFPMLEIGDSSDNVIALKKFLVQTNDLQAIDDEYMQTELYDRILHDAVMEYQHRHGLFVDGVVGKNTLAEMNVPLEDRIRQIQVNMERLRWLPGSLGKKYLLVNLPEFKLRYYENDNLVQEMKIVIGEIENSTPVLKDTMRYIIFNPTWNIPRSIAVKEALPKIKSDSTYLERNHYALLKNSYISKDTIIPDSIDWEQVTEENFNFYMVQKPGSFNALGRVKFMFPNHQAIYLHDTPAKHIFDMRRRDYSHGCIRIEKPIQLAADILKEQSSIEEIEEILESEETTAVVLEEEIMVHFIYQTAWVDDRSKVHFRDDLYLFDQMTLEKLEIDT